MTYIETRAQEFATLAHGRIDQRRKYTDEPYITHPAAVAALVQTVPHTPEMVVAAQDYGLAACRSRLWATVLGLVPFQDGDQWCVLYGKDLQKGIAGFGNSPTEAMDAFEAAFHQTAVPR